MILDQAFEQLKTLVESEIEGRAHSRLRRASEDLSQAIRRIRSAGNEADIAGLLAAAGYARRTACLLFESDRARILTSKGIPSGTEPFLIHDSPALLSAIDSEDTVVASATAGELSEALFAATESSSLPEPKVYLFPVVVHGAVPMVLFAAEEVMPAFLESICASAGLRLEALTSPTAVPASREDGPQLVQISGPPSIAPKWNDLSAAEQSLHLRAQRFAQVAVARMRVERSETVRDGQRRGDLYSALRPEIDGARQEYKTQFLNGQSKAMVDYLYLELVRSLANDEDRLLGSDFPGRLI